MQGSCKRAGADFAGTVAGTEQSGLYFAGRYSGRRFASVATENTNKAAVRRHTEVFVLFGKQYGNPERKKTRDSTKYFRMCEMTMLNMSLPTQLMGSQPCRQGTATDVFLCIAR